MKQSGFTLGYVVALLLLLMIGITALAINALRSATHELNAKISAVETLASRYDYDQLTRNVTTLKQAAIDNNVQVFTRHEVMTSLLAYADYLNDKYKAKITSVEIDNNRTIVIPMSITIVPKNEQAFFSMVSELLEKERPMVYIKDISISLTALERREYTTVMTFELAIDRKSVV